MKVTPRFSDNANVTSLPNGWRMEIPAGDASVYRFAQLDDYARLPRGHFPSRPSLTLSLRARASSNSIAGTWGFGLWNDPFGLSLGFGGNPFRLPTLPNAIWFFHASGNDVVRNALPQSQDSAGYHPAPQNLPVVRNGIPQSQDSTGYHPAPQNLSVVRNGIPQFQDSAGHHPAPQNLPVVENWLSFSDKPGNGFLAQAFRSPAFDARLIPAGLSFPFSRKAARRWLGRIIREDGVRLSVDQTQWHIYRLEWSPTRSAFWVDDALVFESPVSPRPPLGLVIWIDNQFAKFTPEGEIGFGVLTGEAAWIEVENLVVRSA